METYGRLSSFISLVLIWKLGTQFKIYIFKREDLISYMENIQGAHQRNWKTDTTEAPSQSPTSFRKERQGQLGEDDCSG